MSRHEPAPLQFVTRRSWYPWLVVGVSCIGACAAFSKESPMKFANASKLNRKSGVAQWRDLLFLLLQDGFHEIARLVHVDAVLNRQLVGQQLQGNDLQHGG